MEAEHVWCNNLINNKSHPTGIFSRAWVINVTVRTSCCIKPERISHISVLRFKGAFVCITPVDRKHIKKDQFSWFHESEASASGKPWGFVLYNICACCVILCLFVHALLLASQDANSIEINCEPHASVATFNSL